MWYFYSSSILFPRSKYCSQLRICAFSEIQALLAGVCRRYLYDIHSSPAFSVRRNSPSLISIAIQMLTFKATSHTGRGAGLQISEGVEWTAEVKEVDDGEAGRSAYVLRRRLGNPAHLSLTYTSPTHLLLLLPLPHLLNKLRGLWQQGVGFHSFTGKLSCSLPSLLCVLVDPFLDPPPRVHTPESTISSPFAHSF